MNLPTILPAPAKWLSLNQGTHEKRQIISSLVSPASSLRRMATRASRKSPTPNPARRDAAQTRRQELSDAHAADLERLELRKQTSEEFKALSGAAREAGVQSKMFGVFHDAGYKGLYGGLSNEALKTRKRIPTNNS